MSGLRLEDVLIINRNYDPRNNIKPQQFSSNDPSTKELIFTCDEFRRWWAEERQTGFWVHRPNQYSTFYREHNDPTTPLPFKTWEQVAGTRTMYSWRLTFACRRHRKKKVVSLPRESVGQWCKAQIFMAQPVGEKDKVVVRCKWRHNHDDDRAQLPLGRNEREWVRRLADKGHDWHSLSSRLIPDEQSLQAMEDVPYNHSFGIASGNLFIEPGHVRQILSRKKRMEYQKDKCVAKSVKLWFKEIEDKGGKTMFVEDSALTRFEYGWCTNFQLKVMSENTSGYCMDSTHKTVRDITPIDGDSKVFSPAYLFTLLVKDKDICQGIPVAFMVSKSESRYPIIRWLQWLRNECILKTDTFMVDCAEAETHAIGVVFPESKIYYCDFHVGQLWEKHMFKFSEERKKQMRPLLNEVRRARSPELQQILWTRFKEQYSAASSVINYIQKNWFDKKGRLEKWAFFYREDEQIVTTNNWIESWHARLKYYHLDGAQNLRVDRIIYLLQGRVDREFRFAYYKTKRGFLPIPWRKADEERKQKADKVPFDEAQRKICYSKDNVGDDGRLRILIESLDPDTPHTYYTVTVIVRSGQLLSCSCPDFCKRKPLPCKHLFLVERVFHYLWISRFLRPSMLPDNKGNDSANSDISNISILEKDSLRDQLAIHSPLTFTQLEYVRARKEEEERCRRKEQRKREFESVEKELCNNGHMIAELTNKKPKTCSLEDLQAAMATSNTLVQQLWDCSK